ncbi:MAG: PLP-dependent transferase [Actinomycetes bacterium]
MTSEWAPDSRVVASGRPPRVPDAPLNTPIVPASSFHAEGPLEYAREGTPTVAALESLLGDLEGGTAVAFSSGMAAVNAALDAVPAGGVVVAPTRSYTGTAVRLRELDSVGRIRLRTYAADDPSALAAACPGAALVWIETPINPTMEVTDIAAAVRSGHAAGAFVLVDNTFATPLRQLPLNLGADISLHSVTKFIGGHSDLLMGALITGDANLAEFLRTRRVLLGAAPGALEAYLAVRGARTLALRLDRAEGTAMRLAQSLMSHPNVERVLYPGLPSDPGHQVAARQSVGFGSMLSIIVRGGAEAADQVCLGVQLWTYATSLGGVESLIERRRRWPAEATTVPEGLLRLSVGIENPLDLWHDLDAALRGG